MPQKCEEMLENIALSCTQIITSFEVSKFTHM